MTEEPTSPPCDGPARRRPPLWLVAALAALCIGVAVIFALRWRAHVADKPSGTRQSVPWPDRGQWKVLVHMREFRWTNLASRLGPFRMAADGELWGRKDGRPDGEVVQPRESTAARGIGAGGDTARHRTRRGNWYVSRMYVDTRQLGPGKRFTSPYSVWCLNVTYLTGGLEMVSHVPESGLGGVGTAIEKSRPVALRTDVPPPWRKWWGPTVTFRRIRGVERSTGRKMINYYVFSLNGRPEDNWANVFSELARADGSYCYFAKIHFSPTGTDSVGDVAEADAAAEEFVRHFLPEVLKGLPTPDEVERLGAPR